MAQDVFGKEIKPGDICLQFGNVGRSFLIVADNIKPKTIDCGIRSIGLLVITEEQARNHRLESAHYGSEENRLRIVEVAITQSRKLKAEFGIED